MSNAPIFIFAGGGTGGHIFPALAIAEALEEQCPGARFRFLCSDKALDSEILTREGRQHTPIRARPFGLSPRTLLRFAGSWGNGVRTARTVIRSLRREGQVGAMAALGGYVSAPCAQSARAEDLPIVLVNLDAAPGRANRWIAGFARTRCTTAEGEAPADWERLRPIVRRAAIPSAQPRLCRERLGLEPHLNTLFVTGGSQGAGSINQFMAAFAGAHAPALSGWQVLHQSGEQGEQAMREAYQRHGVRAVVVPFCTSMGDAWGAADLAVSRCGAGSVSEVWASGVPTLFMPYPYHRDEHQRKNAEPLRAAGGAIVLKDHIEAAQNLAHAGVTLLELLQGEQKRHTMRHALGALGPADGAQRVAGLMAALARTG